MGPGCAHLLSIHQAPRPPALRWLRADRCSTLAKEESTDSPGCPEQSWVWDGFPSHGWETAWRPGLGWGWPGAPRLSGNAGAPHFVVTAVPLCMVSEEAVVATTPGPGRPCLLPTPGRVVSALRHPYLRETRIQFTGNKSTEKKKKSHLVLPSRARPSPGRCALLSPLTENLASRALHQDTAACCHSVLFLRASWNPPDIPGRKAGWGWPCRPWFPRRARGPTPGWGRELGALPAPTPPSRLAKGSSSGKQWSWVAWPGACGLRQGAPWGRGTGPGRPSLFWAGLPIPDTGGAPWHARPAILRGVHPQQPTIFLRHK